MIPLGIFLFLPRLNIRHTIPNDCLVGAGPARRRPNYATIHRMIDNPIYGGAYAYGNFAAASRYSADGVSVKTGRKARTDWLALTPNAHEGYVG